MTKTYKGSCHCGSVQFEIDSDLAEVQDCDCSICRRRGALYHHVEAANFRLLKPVPSTIDNNTHGLIIYQFNTRVAKDYICPVCGILPFRRPRIGPERWTINVRCLEGVSLEDLNIVKGFGSKLSVVDGFASSGPGPS
jgi:hypothetical protein